MTSDKVLEYTDLHRAMLGLLEQMWSDPRMQCYNDNKMPSVAGLKRSAFLAGPTSRNQLLEYLWRSKAVAYLRDNGFDGYIFVPEPRGGEKIGDFTERDYIHQWVNTTHDSVTRVVLDSQG